jgi:hypothetical protein
MKTRKVRLKRKEEPEKVTRKGTIAFVVLLMLCVVGFVVGVRVGVAKKDSSLLGSSDMKTRGLYYQLKMEKTLYRLGEPIKVRLSITNVSSAPIALKFQKNLEFELTVRKEVDLLFAQVPKTIWKLSENQLVFADVHNSVIDPGKTLQFLGTWDQKDRDGKPVKPGNYQIIGNLLADDRPESLALRGKTEK